MFGLLICCCVRMGESILFLLALLTTTACAVRTHEAGHLRVLQYLTLQDPSLARAPPLRLPEQPPEHAGALQLRVLGPEPGPPLIQVKTCLRR